MDGAHVPQPSYPRQLLQLMLPKHGWPSKTRCPSGETSTQLQTGLSSSEQVLSCGMNFDRLPAKHKHGREVCSSSISISWASALLLFFFRLAYFWRMSHLRFFWDSYTWDMEIYWMSSVCTNVCQRYYWRKRRVWKSVAPSNVRKLKQLFLFWGVFGNRAAKVDRCLTFLVSGRTNNHK